MWCIDSLVSESNGRSTVPLATSVPPRILRSFQLWSPTEDASRKSLNWLQAHPNLRKECIGAVAQSRLGLALIVAVGFTINLSTSISGLRLGPLIRLLNSSLLLYLPSWSSLGSPESVS